KHISFPHFQILLYICALHYFMHACMHVIQLHLHHQMSEFLCHVWLMLIVIDRLQRSIGLDVHKISVGFKRMKDEVLIQTTYLNNIILQYINPIVNAHGLFYYYSAIRCHMNMPIFELEHAMLISEQKYFMLQSIHVLIGKRFSEEIVLVNDETLRFLLILHELGVLQHLKPQGDNKDRTAMFPNVSKTQLNRKGKMDLTCYVLHVKKEVLGKLGFDSSP
ncbi:hypothetical protein ACJX0J_026254, partial [Zea mays]